MKFLVSVRCFTYNQAPYIKETMDGFTMQHTNFPYVCILVDDASPDGEQDVINRYLADNFDLNNQLIARNEETEDYKLILTQHKTNRNCYFAVYYLKYNHYQLNKDKYPYFSEFNEPVKYHAICEGDDCWCHPEKLQMQVDFLETHEEYGMVHTDYDLIKGRRHHRKIDNKDDGNWFPRIITEGVPDIGTLTVLYRKAIYDKIPKLFRGKDWPMDDKPLWYELAHEAKIKYLPVVTAKYRVLELSASHSKDINKLISFKNAGVEIRLFYANYYGVKLQSDVYDEGYYESVIRYACRLDEKNIAAKYFREAKHKHVLSLKARLFYVVSRCSFLKKILEIYIKI